MTGIFYLQLKWTSVTREKPSYLKRNRRWIYYKKTWTHKSNSCIKPTDKASATGAPLLKHFTPTAHVHTFAASPRVWSKTPLGACPFILTCYLIKTLREQNIFLPKLLQLVNPWMNDVFDWKLLHKRISGFLEYIYYFLCGRLRHLPAPEERRPDQYLRWLWKFSKV